jgi:peptidoglycan/xylan/chitin deacetylase (PgdA/CDA1 family)
LSNWFNATTHIEKQKQVEKWIKEHYPEIWTQMEAIGWEVALDGFGWRVLRIDRKLEP